MLSFICACLLITGTVLLGQGQANHVDTSLDGQQMVDYQKLFLHRQVRSATGGVPCVTVSFLTELKDRFVKWLDHNNDGQSTFDEVKNYIRRFKPEVSDAVVAAFIRRRDSNGNGAIDFVPEYVHDMSAPDLTMEGAKEWFHLQDTNDDGYVTESELVKMAEAVGMSPEEALDTVQGYYMSADQDKDGKLTFDEFKTLYSP